VTVRFKPSLTYKWICKSVCLDFFYLRITDRRRRSTLDSSVY